MIFSLGPLTQDAEGVFAGPAGTLQVLDLAPLPLQGRKRMAVLASDDRLPGCEVLTEKNIGRARGAIESHFGFYPDGLSLHDLLIDALTRGADPTGDAFTLPLMPTHEGDIEIWWGGERIYCEAFRFGLHSHTSSVRALLRHQVQQHFEEAKHRGGEHHRRVLDALCQKYRTENWKEFVTPKLAKEIPGRLPHATTYSDSFNRANEATLAAPWVMTTNQIELNTNIARCVTNNSLCLARYNSALSTDDHFCQFTVVSFGASSANIMGPVARHSSSDATYYLAGTRGDGVIRIDRVVAGGSTSITSGTATFTTPVVQIRVNGSTIRHYIDGLLKLSVTDTSISGHLFGGARGVGNTTAGSRQSFDVWSVTDLLPGINTGWRGLPVQMVG